MQANTKKERNTGNAWVLGLGFKGGRGGRKGTWGRRRAFLEMAVSTAQTPGSVSWIGWSANFCATARTSSGVTLGGVGVATEQDASSLAAVLGVTTRSAHGSGAIARARRAPPPAAGARAVAGRRNGRAGSGREGTGGWGGVEAFGGRRHTHAPTHGHGARRVLPPAVVRGL